MEFYRTVSYLLAFTYKYPIINIGNDKFTNTVLLKLVVKTHT